MAEQLELTTPQTSTVTTYSVRTIVMSLDGPMIRATVVDDTGHKTSHEYVDAEALTLILQLNKANLSMASLQRRVIERLVADGRLPPGTITGTPD